jgi:hypothetical protein
MTVSLRLPHIPCDVIYIFLSEGEKTRISMFSLIQISATEFVKLSDKLLFIDKQCSKNKTEIEKEYSTEVP